MPLRRLTPLVFLLLALPAARALEWQDTVQQVNPAPFADQVVLTFRFKNSGSQPVHIRDVQGNCHCITAETDKTIYAPGESGQLTAHFTVGDRFGLYERKISVATDDVEAPQLLTARIDVPDLATVTPRLLEWKPGSAANEQTVDIQAGAGLQIDFIEAISTNETFQARLETVEAGRLYRLRVRPNSTATDASAAIRIRGRERTGHDVLVSAYANIR